MGKRILIAAPVRQKDEIFKEYLNSLNNLIIPNEYEIDKFFYLHNCSELSKYLNSNEYEIINDDTSFLKEYNKPKIWKEENFNIVSQLRTNLLHKAAEENYDYLFTVDSDLLLHPKTLSILLNDNKKIVGNLLWTKINNQVTAICGKDEEWGPYSNEELEKIKQPGLYPIGWTCACLLISSDIFKNKNISYYPIIGVDNTKCEDYAFCLRIKCNYPNEEIWIDTRLPARHLYHEQDYNRWIKDKKLYE